MFSKKKKKHKAMKRFPQQQEGLKKTKQTPGGLQQVLRVGAGRCVHVGLY